MRRSVLPALGCIAFLVVVSGCSGSPAENRGWPIVGTRRAKVFALVYAKATDLSGNHSWIWRARLDGTNAVRLTEGAEPQLSPDGYWIAFVRYESGPRAVGLFVIASAGGRPRLLRRVVGSHAFIGEVLWAPDSRHLVTVETSSLTLVDARTGSAQTIARATPRLTGPDQPTFAPNSRAVAYARYDQTGADVYVYYTRSGRTRRISRDHRASQPLWGPSGIAFNRGGAVDGDVWLVRADGTGLRRLTWTRAGIFPAAWSADGKRLLAANPATHNGRLWAVDVRSGRARDLTGWVGDLFPQGLTGDGRTVLAAIGCGGLISPYGIVETLPFAGGKPRVIVHGPCRASWNR